MTRMTFVLANGQARTVEAHEGDSVMRAAVGAGIDAIEAICGGSLSCATCHVYVDEKWIGRVPPPRDDELAMLDFTEVQRTDRSRLSCQIELTSNLDGLVVEVPAAR